VSRPTAVVVAGALANKAGNGGEAWVRLSWVRGFRRLGVPVWFVEELAPAGDSFDADESAEVEWFRSITDRFGLADRASLLVESTDVVGPSLDDLLHVAPSAVLVNISGHLRHRDLKARFARRVLVDIDPGFTQIWHASGAGDDGVEGHDQHFTIASNIGRRSCSIPLAGLEWETVRPPVVLDDWPVTEPPDPARFTTVANWRGPFGPVELEGRTYGLKVHEFRRFIDLPVRSPHHFELALNIDPADERDREALLDHGWQLVDPLQASRSPEAFRDYIQSSGAEFSVAQGIYVDTRSGWFSDRTVRYLASGRPALVQDTGFGDRPSRTDAPDAGGGLPTGEGLIAFGTLDEAVAGADRLVADPAAHAAAARRLAEEHFDSDRVLARFGEQVGLSR
jgi:hypothetical protein